MRSVLAVWSLAAFLILKPGGASGQQADSAAAAVARPHSSAPVLHAAPLVGDVHLDGRLDDDAWRAATPVDQFTQREPKEGQPATERVDVVDKGALNARLARSYLVELLDRARIV